MMMCVCVCVEEGPETAQHRGLGDTKNACVVVCAGYAPTENNNSGGLKGFLLT